MKILGIVLLLANAAYVVSGLLGMINPVVTILNLLAAILTAFLLGKGYY